MLLVCLLNIPLRQHEKERFLLLKCMELCLSNHKRNFFFPFRINHGMLHRLLGEKEVPQHVR